MQKRAFLNALFVSTMLASVPAIAQMPWDGPTAGPDAARDKSVVVVAADLKNGGILGVTNGVEEASAKIGWDVRVLDGAGSIQGRTAAIGQALALQPDGIIINGFDAVEQQAALEDVTNAGIPMVAWHSGPKIGCDAPGGIFANVSTDAMTVSEVAAQWAIDDGGKDIGVVIFTDSTYQIAIDKADRLKETIEAAGGTVLEYVDTPIADTSTRMGPLTISLLQKHGDDWTHALAINDLYFDFMGPSLAVAGLSPERAPQAGSAGDGSEAAFQRIRSGGYQAITVAEPLNLQGWQLI
ncbi:MAG: substrate-binding domain-containing protein, partial [Pseudomonadota bacterium]